MPNSSANPPEAKADAAPGSFLPSLAAASGESARWIKSSRPLSIIRDASSLRWRYGERLDDVIEDACRRFRDRLAVDVDGAGVSFRELDARANQMARVFIANGVKPGDRVAVLLDRGPEAYAALFALMKARATFVPLDANHPPERIGYVLRDASVSRIVTHLRMADRFVDSTIPRLILDKARRDIAEAKDTALGDHERRPDGRGALLCPIHLGYNWPSERGRGRASQHLQFRPGRRGELRFRTWRSRLSGDVDCF